LKKILLTLLFFSLLISACSTQTNNPSFTEDERLKISVSIASIQWLVDQIGGDQVQTQSLTTSGDDPHTYEPSPAQMIAIAASDLYFTAGVEFEEVWIPKFTEANSNLQVVDISEGIDRIPVADHNQEEGDEHEGLDPHIWLSTENMRQIARNIASSLESIDSENSAVYQSNLQNALEIINEVNDQLTQKLSQTQRQQFLIIHPSLGYFADAFGLQMIPVEVDGQEPSPTQLVDILNASKTYGIHTLFTQTGSNPLNVQMLAEQAGINQIIEIDPMLYDWSANMLFIGDSLQAALN
jgi:zinc transport system substrate-binding protein